MAAKRKQGALSQVGETVSNAARTALNAADEYLVDPVGNFLGLTGKNTQARKSPAGKRPQRKRPARPSTRTAKAPAKRGAKRPAKRPVKAAGKRPVKGPAKRPVKPKPSAASRRPSATRAAKPKRR